MKRLILSRIVYSGIFVIILGCRNGEPEIRFSSKLIQMDTIAYPLQKDFEIGVVNIGDDQVKIFDMTSGCDCTIFYEDSPVMINPGDSISIRGRIEPNISDIGNHRQILLTLKTNTTDVFHSIPIQYFVVSNQNH